MTTTDESRGAGVLGIILTIAGPLCYASLMRALWQAAAFGPICRHSGLGHCPACYAALAMTALGLGLLGFAAASGRTAQARLRGPVNP